ncbi:MAG: hypothetical protein CVV22_07670 [Ignavibacteriae bacterium HGW-Ignavibacteriae-1]|jgi:hypothetical protein|nr:MAG: hypothetical protein CVV22_07670 [Ignavibacteriae bacterium HGW-Ignavibacteriae-1]
MEMNKILIILIGLFIVSCDDKTEIVLDIVYKDTVVKFSSESSAFELDSIILLQCKITNSEKQNLYIPIAFFQIQSSLGEMLFTSPDNTFDNTFIYNTIYIYPRNISITSLSHMNGGVVTDSMPNFLRIKPNESTTFIISFPKKFINNGEIRKRLIDTVQYTAHMKLAIIKESKFVQLLEVISVHKHLEKFVQHIDTLKITSDKMDMIINETFPLSEFKIGEFQSLVINEMCNVKVDIIFDIDKKITDENAFN